MSKLPFSGETIELNKAVLGGAKSARLKTAKPKRNADQAWLFLAAWEQHAPDWRKKYATPEPEVVFAPPRKFRFDWCFPVQGIAVEVDGGQWSGPGGGYHGGDSDREKMNLAAIGGYRVMHFTPSQLRKDPAGCIKLVVQAMEFRE